MPCEYQDITGYGDWVWICPATGDIYDEFPDDEDNRLACEAECGEAPPPERRTEMTLYCTPRSAPLGGTSNAYGILRTITDVGLINKPVRLYRKKPGESYRYLYYVRTDGSGGYMFPDIRIDKLGNWSFYTEFEGDADYDECVSPEFEVECYAAPPEAVDTEITVALSPNEGLVPHEGIVVSGKLTEYDTGDPVQLRDVDLYWRRPSEEDYRLCDTVSTISDGTYRVLTSMIYEEGPHEFYSKFVGDEDYKPCMSNLVIFSAVGVIDTSLEMAFITEPERAGDTAVMRGRLLDDEENGVPNMEITVHHHVSIGGVDTVELEGTLTTDSLGVFTHSSPEVVEGWHTWEARFEGYTVEDNSVSYGASRSDFISTYVLGDGEPPEVEPPEWKEVYSKDFPDAKMYEGKCTHEDVAFLVDPLKLISGEDWEKWAEEELPQDVIGQYEDKNATPLRLKVHVGTTKVLWGTVDYPAVRVESWHHGSPQIILVLALTIGLIIIVWAFLAWLFKEVEELDWKLLPVGLGALGWIIVGLMILGKRRPPAKPPPEGRRR